MVTLFIAVGSLFWALWMAYISSSKGTRRAVWLSWFASILLVTGEIKLTLPGVGLNMPLVATSLGLGFLLFDQRVTRPRLKFGAADAFMFAWIAAQFMSAIINGKAGPSSIPGLIDSSLPYYLLGRFFLGSFDDLERAARSFAPILALNFAYMWFESITHINPQFRIFGTHSGSEVRFGLLRAHGVAFHSISMGLVLVAVLPWAWEAARQAKAKVAPMWRRFTPWLVLGATITTLSRGPILGVIITTYVRTALLNRKLRVPLVVLAIVGAAGGYFLKNEAAEFLDQLAGGDKEVVQYITIKGQEYIYTGSYHRYLLFLVYEDYLQNAGLFGFGHNFDMTFLYETGLSKFDSIDSAYIQIVIENGYFGVSVLTFWGVVCGAQLYVLARDYRRPYARFAAATCAVLVAIYILLLTVYLSPEIARILYFTFGLTGTLVNLKTNEKRAPRIPPAPFVPQPASVQSYNSITP